MRKLFTVPEREQSRSEELANSVSHGLGLVGAILGATYLIMQAARHGNLSFIIGASVFSTTMIALYFLSTLYHALPIGKTKQLFRAIEQAMIFLFIASTYTPSTLGILHGSFGWTLFFLIWGLAMLGVALLILDKMSRPIIFNSLYLLMGWIVVIAFEPILAKVPLTGIYLIIAGGVAYTVGVFFSRHRFDIALWAFYLALMRHGRDIVSLLCSTLVCHLTLRYDQDGWKCFSLRLISFHFWDEMYFVMNLQINVL